MSGGWDLDVESKPRHSGLMLAVCARLTGECLGQPTDGRHHRPLTGARTRSDTWRTAQSQHLPVDRLSLAQLQLVQQLLTTPSSTIQALLKVRVHHGCRHLAFPTRTAHHNHFRSLRTPHNVVTLIKLEFNVVLKSEYNWVQFRWDEMRDVNAP